MVFFERYKKSLIKIYVKPADPKTAAQLSRRASYRFVNKIWNFLPQPLFNSIWRVVSSQYNSHNNFVKENQNSNSEELNFDLIKVSKGDLEPVNELVSIRYPQPSRRAIFKWTTAITGNGSPDDHILLVLICYMDYRPDDDVYSFVIYTNDTRIRSDSTGIIITDMDYVCDFLFGYVSVINYPILNSSYVSDSKGKQVIIY